jgi:hypothetical protein
MKHRMHFDRNALVLTLCFLLAVLLGVRPASSSIVPDMDLEGLVRESDSIIQGVVESVTSEWDNDKKLIFTYASIRVDDPLKGERRRTLLIRQMGGQVGALVLSVPGMPEFDEGMGIIVFLKDAGNGTFHVVGLNQGRYVIEEDFATANISGVDLVSPKTGLVTDASFVRRVGLEDFKAQIRGLVAGVER